MEQDWIFTFGYGQEHGPSNYDFGGYAVFHGTYSSARSQMVAHFGDKWAFQYDNENGLKLIKKYNLRRINELESTIH